MVQYGANKLFIKYLTLFYNVELILLLIAQQKYKAENVSKCANKKSEQRKIKNEI